MNIDIILIGTIVYTYLYMITQKPVRVFLTALSISIALVSTGSTALAAGESVSIQNVSPTGGINPGTMVTFTASAHGFVDAQYSVSDSAPSTNGTTGTIDTVGFFMWTPTIFDAGKHTLTVTVTDPMEHTASASVTILVIANIVMVTDISPGKTVSLGEPLTFTINAPGFISPTYTAYDTYSMSTFSATSTLSSSGAFSWTPTSTNDLGTRPLLIRASDMYGHNAQTVQNITVINPAVSSTTTTALSTPTTTNTTLSPNTSVTTTSSTGLNSTYLFTTGLSIGSRGNAVLELQKRITTLGWYSGPITGYFGALTAAGVKRLQGANGLEPVGNVGPLTRALLNK